MKFLSFTLTLLFSFSAFAGKGESEKYNRIFEAFTGAAPPSSSVLDRAVKGFSDFCKATFRRAPVVPSKDWTRDDHDPQNQQSILMGGFLFFIDEGRVFVKDITDVRAPFHISEVPLHITGISKVKSIVLFNEDLTALTEEGNVYQFDLNLPSKRVSVSERRQIKKGKWVKIGEAEHIAVSELSDGTQRISMSSRLDPMTGKPL